MTGKPKNLERGVQGGSVELDVAFRRYSGGPYADDDSYETNGTYPTVSIYNPDDVVVEESEISGNQPVRESKGNYTFTRQIAVDDATSDGWKIVWGITINGAALEFTEYFSVVPAGSAEFGDEEQRVGYAFNNPDLTSNHHAPAWGMVVTPDEMRYVEGFGTKLVSPDANQTIDDNMLQNWIDNTIAYIELRLGISLIPRKIMYRGSPDPITGQGEIRLDGQVPEEDDLNLIEPGYPFRQNPARHYLFMQLRNRPVRTVESASLSDPVQAQLINLLPWMVRGTPLSGILQFFPSIVGIGMQPLLSTFLLNNRYPLRDFPNAFLIDYSVGYAHSSKVPRVFRDLIRWTAALQLLGTFGDGKSPGIASASVNLNSISESFATTQSASIGHDDCVRLFDKKSFTKYDFKIGDLYLLKQSGSINVSDYYVETVNPNNTKESVLKNLLDVVEHHVPGKRYFRITSKISSIVVTEDHSLFVIEDEKLIQKKSGSFKVGDAIAVKQEGHIINDRVTHLVEVQVPGDLVYDLSVKDYQNFIVNNRFVAHNTNALYGAHILQYNKMITEWYKFNEMKFSNAFLGVL